MKRNEPQLTRWYHVVKIGDTYYVKSSIFYKVNNSLKVFSKRIYAEQYIANLLNNN